MKIYLISHAGKPQWHKLESWVDIEKVGKNEIYVKSVRAFLKKKEAVNWLKDKGESWSHLKVISAEITNIK